MAINNISDLQTLTNTTGLADFAKAVNNEVNGLIGISLYFMIVGILFVSLKSRGFETSDTFIVTSFVGFIMCLLLRALSLIPDVFLYANMVLLGFAGVVLIVSRT